MNTSPQKESRIANRFVAIVFLLTIIWCFFIGAINLYGIGEKIYNDKFSPQPILKIKNTRPEIPPAPMSHLFERKQSPKQNNKNRVKKTKTRSFWPPPQLEIEGHRKIITRLQEVDNATKFLFRDINTTMHRLLRIDAINDGVYYVIGQNDGALAYVTLKDLRGKRSLRHEHYSRIIKDVKALQDARDGNVLVIRYPEKPTQALLSEKWQSLLTLTDEEFNKSIELLSPEVPCLDLIKKADETGMKITDLMFYTDHHWTPEGAFWAFQNIAAYYKEKSLLSVPSEYVDIKNYVVDTYPRVFLGSTGARVGSWVAGKDDFSLIYPRFSTDFERWEPRASTYRKGDFRDVFFLKSNFDFEVHSTPTLYSTYLGNDAIIIIRNNKAINKKRLLLVRDSFGNLIAPFLSILFEEIYIVDPRQYRRPLDTYVDELKPDCVIFLIAPRRLKLDSGKN